MSGGLSPRAQRLYSIFAPNQARRLGSTQVYPEHLMIAVILETDGGGYDLLKKLGINIPLLLNKLEEGIREFPDSVGLRITSLKNLLEASGQDRELCLQTIERFLKECPKLAGEEEFQKLMREYGINVEGGKVWAEKADP